MGTLYPIFWIGSLAAAAVFGISWLLFGIMRRAGLEFWQALALANLSGYLVLNYGFDNLAVHVGGFPILIGYGLMYTAFALAVYARRQSVTIALKEPALLCVLSVLVLALFHMLTDVPSYGAWAFRDFTMCLDGLFLLMGLLWAMKSDDFHFLGKWLLLIYVLNMVYSYTLPWHEKLFSWSPESGAFVPVPLLGNYHGSGDVLLAGAMFCICVGSYVVSRRRWLLPFLALAQLLGIAITQVRRMYVGILVVILILVMAGEIKKFARLFILVPAAIAVLFAVTGLGGLEISGRIGKVNLDFFKEHIRSMSGAEDTPGSDPYTRVTMAEEAMKHFYAHPVFGVGFGRPLISDVDPENGLITRIPHNSSITYLARLGSVGFVFWIAFHLCLWSRFFYAFRQRHFCDKRVYAFVLWSFLLYVLFMMSSFVEGPFEYPATAIPFYFLIGFSLGLIRWHLSPKDKTERSLVAFPSSAETAYL
ncbi:MAG TPA: O-antigen ligase family protein [Candidatus Sulfotelmatobacter sp.]|nr:O-antigen ligase family protein [Candidatus Sulfotelmatobacter sp.]